VAWCKTCAHVGAGIGRCGGHWPASLHLLDFGNDLIECGPIIKGFVIDRNGVRWWEVGNVALGVASDGASFAMGAVGRWRPSAHQLCDFISEGAVNVVVIVVLWKE